MTWRPSAAIALALVAGLPVSACGRQVDVPAPESPAPACASIAFPDAVAGAGRRPTGEDGTAAWGEPPITARCGVPRPAALTPTSQLLDVDGVGWLPIEGQGGSAFVAVDWPSRQAPVYVEVIVPDAYADPADVLADISPALAG